MTRPRPRSPVAPGAWCALAILLCLAAPAARAAEPAADKAADDYNMAVWLYSSRKYDLSADEFASFLKKYPTHEKAADARLGMARALLHAGKNDEAVAALAELRQKHPDFKQMPEVMFHLGQAQVAAGRMKEAADVFDEIARKYADHYLAGWAQARRGEALVLLKNYDEAEKTLAPLVERFLTGKDAAKNLKAERDRLQKAAPNVAAGFDALLERAHLNLGLARFGAGRFDAARQAFEEFLALAPKSGLAETARFHLAQSLYKAGQFPRAAEVYGEIAKGKGEMAPDAAFEMALALYQAKKYKEAASAFGDCAKKFPKAARAGKARLYAGTCLYLAKDYRNAIDQLKKEDKDPEAQYWLGMAYLRENKPAEARQTFEKVLAAGDGPRAADALLGQADALLAEGKNDEAAAAYQQFAAKFGAHADLARALYAAAASLHRSGKYDDSETFCVRFLEKAAKDDLAAQVLFISGENRFLQKKYAEAAAQYQKLLETRADSPDAPAARFRLAWIKYFGKDCDGALELLGRIDPAKADKALLAEAEYLRGNCLLEKKQDAPAAEAFGKYLDQKDAKRYRDDALLKWAVALDRAGKRGDAVARLRQFLKEHDASPLKPEAEYQLAEALVAEGKPDEAAAHYKAVADGYADHRLAPFALYGLGTCMVQKGDVDQTAAAFGRLAEKYPKSELVPQALYQQATVLAKTGKFAEARAAYKALVDRFGGHDLAPAAMLGMGLALEKEKKFDEAAVAFRKLAEQAKDDKTREQAAYELAWSLQQAGKDKESAQAYRALSEKFPKSALAADAFFYLAEVPYGEKKYDEAVALYEKALAAAKDARLKDKVLYRLGWCRWGQQKYPEAAALFDRLVAEAPASDLVAESLLQAGESYARAGKANEAIDRLQKLLDPKYKDFEHAPDARLRLGEAQALLGHHDKAVATLTALEQAYPKYKAMAEVQFTLGKALYDLKRHDQARQRFQKALATTETETAAKSQFYLGETYLAEGNPREALKAYLRVVALWAAYKEWAAAAQFETGKCYQDLGKAKDAREAFQAVVDKYGDTKWAAPAKEKLKT